MDTYKIDSHKLLYHVPRVHNWMNDKLIYPIYMEVSPSGACNHRCTFCALDFMEYQKRYLDFSVFQDRLREMGRLGIKSIMYAGEGEPLLHKNITEIIKHTKNAGIDVAVTTNGVLFRESLIKEILGEIEWVKISLNAGTRETYAAIHNTRSSDFDKVIANLAVAVDLKKTKGYSCTIGTQMLLLPENYEEALDLARTVKDIGVDYLVIKPYSHHDLSKTNKYKKISYNHYSYLDEQLTALATKEFNVIFRKNTMKKLDTCMRNYESCMALPFWSYIDAGGNVWGCSAYLGDENFLCGNIYENTFQDIWESRKRTKLVQWAAQELDTDRCRRNCRMDEINSYLWDLKHPPAHVNFI